MNGLAPCRFGRTRWLARQDDGTAAAPALLAAHDVAVIGRRFEEAAVDHPVDFFLKFVGLVGLDPDEFGHQPALALLWRKITQHLFARAVLVLAQPVDGAIER